MKILNWKNVNLKTLLYYKKYILISVVLLVLLLFLSGVFSSKKGLDVVLKEEKIVRDNIFVTVLSTVLLHHKIVL